jgi:hypothetical protein
MNYLPFANALEVLYLDICGNLSHFPNFQICLPQLHSLHLRLFQADNSHDRALRVLASWNVPSCLFLSLYYQQYTSNPGLEEFLRAFGPGLETLELQWDPVLLPISTGHCSSIQNLCVHYPLDTAPCPPLPPTPHLRRVQLTGRVYTRSFLESVEEMYVKGRPSLRCIKFRDLSGASFFAELDDVERARWTDWGGRLLAKNIRWEDKYGELVSCVTSYVDFDSDDEREVFLKSRAARLRNGEEI